MKNVKNVKNEGLKLREFEILLRMLAGGKIQEPNANYIIMIPLDENGNNIGLPWSITDMKRSNIDFINTVKSTDIELLEKVVSKKETGAIDKAKKFYKDGKYDELWRLLVGRAEFKDGTLKGLTSGVALREYKRAYLRNNNPKNGQTNITTLSLLDVSEECLILAKEANYVLAEERKLEGYGNYGVDKISKKPRPKSPVVQVIEEIVTTTKNRTTQAKSRVSEGREK